MKNFTFLKVIFVFTILCLVHINLSAKTSVNTLEVNFSKSIQVKNGKKKKRSRLAYIRGPRGGCYFVNGKGKKTYVSKNLCR